MDEEVWQVTDHGVAKSQTQLNDFTFTFSGKPFLILHASFLIAQDQPLTNSLFKSQTVFYC